MNNPRIFIIGASGFVGSAILKAFTENSTSLDIYAAENRTPVKEYSSVKKIKTSLSDVPKAIIQIRPDIIVHAARISAKNYRFLGRRRAALSGHYANRLICRTALQNDIKLLFISGSLIYGSNPGKKVTEDFPLNPTSYAIEYSKAERPFIKNYAKSPITICRPGWIFGPNSWFKVFFEDIINRRGYVPQYGNGENFMDIIHRDDLGRLVKEYALHAPYSKTYNLFSRIALRQKDFVQQLAAYYKKEIKVIPRDQIIQEYDPVTCDALTCDIPLATNYSTIIDHFDFQYNSIKDLLAAL